MSRTIIRDTFERIAGPVVAPAIKKLPVIIRIAGDPADRIIAYAYEQFRSGRWQWIQGTWQKGANRFCLQQALVFAGIKLGVRAEVTTAVIRVKEAIGTPWSIPDWNDSSATTFEDVMYALEKAMVGVK